MLEKHKEKIAINSIFSLLVAVFSWYAAYSLSDATGYNATLDSSSGDGSQQQVLFIILNCFVIVLSSWLLLVVPYFSRQQKTPQAISSLLVGLVLLTSTLNYLHGTWLLLIFMGGNSLFGV